MKRAVKLCLFGFAALTVMLAWGPVNHSLAQSSDPVTLAAPDKTGGKPLMEALALRQTSRDFAPGNVSGQDLSNLLWATWGANRPDGKRTAPTAKNTQEVNVYVALEGGVYLYDGIKHELQPVLSEDVRPMFNNAPLVLIYAAPENDYLAGMHVGSLYQNAGLYCASAGLSNVVKQTGAEAMKNKITLPKGYRYYVIQEVGMAK